MDSRYADVHKTTDGPGDARPTALEIVKDEGLEGKLSNKAVIITGCSSGIGIETARAMAATGARLFLGVRDLSKGQSAVSDILKPGHVELLEMDLNSLASVRAAVDEFKSKCEILNILINNAGVMAPPQGKTADGFETQFGINHLAHFLLFQLLKPLLLASATPEFPSCVVNLSSSGHRDGTGVQFGDYNFEKSEYTPWASYSQAKTANIYMANEIERRYGSKGLHATSVQPGGVYSGLQKHVPEAMMSGWKANESVKKYMKNPEQGAATTVWAALSRDWKNKGGKYLEDCAESVPVERVGDPLAKGYAPHAFNEEGEKRLWRDSLQMLGLQDDE